MMLISGGSYGLNLFNKFFNDPFFTSSTEKNSDSRKLPVMRTNITEKNGDYIMEIGLLGFKKENIKAELKDECLTISAEHDISNESKDDKGTVIHRECYTNPCRRTFFVSEHIRQGDIKTGFGNGILELQVPKDTPRIEETPEYIDILQSLPSLAPL